MSVLDNFETWKDFLGDRLNQAENQGLSREELSDLAFEIGDYLAKQVDAENPEEAVLRDLWEVANNDERHAIANMMIKLVENENTH
ncbi:uncharacterized protein DUF3243 [Melghiribacillus thermohalophilus]|uniref:Uncharacterized protein DUF3243 n=1 Tax=Melghiribacillus thermohalophilus TaxID=1324956 RepID=A0A4R3NHD6_9BACI|nr:DUF3243 domain-containing protein [Melghiribacillus thermohalophilus]TCT26702.1 uncharacterized protein DUF3243 [Melghiribacillus thermohalophilus]